MTTATVLRRRGRQAALSVAALAVAAACGVEERVLSSGGTSDLDTAVARFALAACERFEQCSPTYIRAAHGSYDRCVERTKLLNAWIAGLPGVVWTSEFFVDCAVAWNNLPCDEVFSPFTVEACRKYGSRSIGEQCNFGAQCSSGFCKQTGYQCGVCAEQPPPASPCEIDGDCAEAQWCMPNKTCRTPSGLNQPCSADIRCRNDLTCSGGSCVAPPATAGASCDGSSGLFCDFYSKGLYCTSAKTCASASAKAQGQSCAEGGSYCERNGACSNGICAAAPADNGGSCDNDAGLYCEWPALCVAGSCQLPTSAGLCAR